MKITTLEQAKKCLCKHYFIIINDEVVEVQCAYVEVEVRPWGTFFILKLKRDIVTGDYETRMPEQIFHTRREAARDLAREKKSEYTYKMADLKEMEE